MSKLFTKQFRDTAMSKLNIYFSYAELKTIELTMIYQKMTRDKIPFPDYPTVLKLKYISENN